MSSINFILSSKEYVELFLKIKNRDTDKKVFELVEKLMCDHSNLLKEVIFHPSIELNWSEEIKQDKNRDEYNGEENPEK